jgi:thymidylate synthase (FAD)
MTVLEQKATIARTHIDEQFAVNIISEAAATCFGSKPLNPFDHVNRIYKKGHLSVFEHVNVTMELVTDIATYKGLTRHRHCAFTIESTHYKAYEHGLCIVRVPDMPDDVQEETFGIIEDLHQFVLDKYGKMVARNVLPQAQAAKVWMTTNMREWFHIFDLRKGKENTTNMWQLMKLIMEEFERVYPFFMELYDWHV